MYWIHVIIASFFINSIDGNIIRSRRQQPSGSLYGNSNLGANQAAPGYNNNNPSNTMFYGTNVNNQGPKDLYGNSMVPSNTGNMNNMGGLNNPQQQQPMYGASGQSLGNPTGPYSPSGTNQLSGNMAMRDNSGNLMPAGSSGSSFYNPSSNPQMGYLSNPNQNPMLTNKDLQSNTNNNQFGFNNNPYPNSNNYGGQMPSNTNNLWANQNQFQSNAGNAWGTNRDLSIPNNNNNNAYLNKNSPYFYNNNGHRMITSCLILFLSFLAIIFFHN